MTFYALYRADGSIAGFGLVTNAGDLPAGAALPSGTSLLQVADSTYRSVCANPAGFKVANDAVTAA